ncbi:MAG: glycosyltransferase, partial [Rubripirellula sp.]|nr:glycosyltransferase [Rubripirellula sp.]
QYVANARFVILPSRIDNIPNTALEAMALGRVVIGTQNASFDQLIDDKHNGFVVPQNNEAIQTAIETAWNLNHEQRRRIGTAAEESIDRLNPKSASSELSELFEQVATKKQL